MTANVDCIVASPGVIDTPSSLIRHHRDFLSLHLSIAKAFMRALLYMITLRRGPELIPIISRDLMVGALGSGCLLPVVMQTPVILRELDVGEKVLSGAWNP